jgi:hypothetical protein
MHAERLDLPERGLHSSGLGRLRLLREEGIAGQIVAGIVGSCCRVDQLSKTTVSVHQVVDKPEREKYALSDCRKIPYFLTVLGIRIRMFLGLLDTDPLVRGTDPDPDPSLFA